MSRYAESFADLEEGAMEWTIQDLGSLGELIAQDSVVSERPKPKE
jgi:hypothetical protein